MRSSILLSSTSSRRTITSKNGIRPIIGSHRHAVASSAYYSSIGIQDNKFSRRHHYYHHHLQLLQQQQQDRYHHHHHHHQRQRCLSSSSSSSNSSSSSSGGGDGESSSISSSSTVAFDRNIKTLQRDNAARAHQLWHYTNKRSDDDDGSGQQKQEPVDYDYFREEIAKRLVDRLDDIKRDGGFPLALDIGSGPGYIHRAICAEESLLYDIDGIGGGGIGGVRKLVQMDSSKWMLFRDSTNNNFEGKERVDTYRLEGEEEDQLPFPDGTFDLVISSCAFHWINNLPFLFKEAHRVLKPDGCFMFAMVGGTTLPELRVAMVMAELEREGGVSPHVGPFVELSDIGSLLQRANFALPTIDVDTIHISYPDAFVLMEHLQRMGENNASIKRRQRTARDTFLAAACIYDELYGSSSSSSSTGQEDHDDGTLSTTEVEASAQVIFAIGWTPDQSQQKPDARGSATHKIGEVVVEKTDNS